MTAHLSIFVHLTEHVRLALDPIFPLVELQSIGKRPPAYDILSENKFQLVFDERIDAKELADYITKRQFSHAISKCGMSHNLVDEIEEEEEGVNSDEETGEVAAAT